MASYIIEIYFIKGSAKVTKTKWLVGGVVTSLMTGTLFGCAQDLPPKPNDKSCSDWDWDDELGYGSVMIVVQVIVDIISMAEILSK